MADGREIHGRVVFDAVLDTTGLRKKAEAALSKNLTVKVDGKFSRVQLQTALTTEAAKGRGLSVNIAGKFAITQLRTALKEATAGKSVKTQVDAVFKRSQVQLAIKEALAGKPPRVTVEMDVRRGALTKVIAEAGAAQREITDFENKELEKRKTLHDKALRQIQAAEGIANAKIEQEQSAAAGRRQVITDRSNARQIAQDQLFQQRRFLAAERAQRQLQARANKPIFQKVLVDTREVSRSFEDMNRIISRALRTSLLAFTAWSAGVGLILTGVATLAIVQFAKLEEATARASSVFAGGAFADALEQGTATARTFGDTIASVSDQIEASSKKIALQTLFNPTEVAQGFQAAAQAGLEFRDAQASLLPVTQFAQNELLGVNEALELLTGGLSAAGKSGGADLQLLADQFTLVGNSSNATAKQVAEAFSNQAAAAFRSYGQSAEQALAVINLFGKANLRGLEAGTQTAILIREINNAAFNKSPEAFRKFGIAVEDAQGRALPFTKVLGRLAQVFEGVRRNEGNAGVARLRKELGLTERSLRGLIILLPQLEKLGVGGLEKQVRLIQQAQGSVARQAKPIQDTIAFQFQQTLENVQNLFTTFGKGARDELIGAFSAFNGPGGILAQLDPQVSKLGDRFGELVGQFARFTQSPEARDGARILVDAIRETLVGIRDSFKAFAEAFGQAEGTESTFVAIAQSIRAFAQVGAAVLPEVASILGVIFDFMIDHADAFETFAKLAVATTAVGIALKFVVEPILTVGKFIERAGISAGAAEGTVARLAVGFTELAGPVGLVIAAIDFGIGVVQGFREELARTRSENEEFNRTLVELQPLIREFTAGLGDLLAFGSAVLGMLREFGHVVGSVVANAFVTATIAQGDFFRGMNQLLRGDLISAAASFGDAFGNLIILPIREGLLFAGESLVNFFELLSKAPGQAHTFDPFIDRAKVLNAHIRDFSLNMSEANIVATNTLGNMANNAAIAGTSVQQLANQWIVVGDAAFAASQQQASAFEVERAIREFSFATTAEASPHTGVLGAEHQAARQAFSERRASAQTQRIIDEIAAAQQQVLTDIPATAGAVGDAVQRSFQDPMDIVQRQLDALKPSERLKEAQAAIASVTAAGEDGYQATRREVLLLKDAMPSLDAAIQKQRDEVSGLDEALQSLRDTQLQGTKAFSDKQFALEQSVKRLQLQRFDLIAAGAKDGDDALKAIDTRIESLQKRGERIDLVESLKLDPLRRKLDEAFNPTTEASFANIIQQFRELSKQRGIAGTQLETQERRQKLVSAAADAGATKFGKLDDAARRAHEALQEASRGASSASTAIRGVSRSAGAAATNINNYSTAVEQVPSGRGVVDRSLRQIDDRVNELSQQFTNAGRQVMIYFATGIQQGTSEAVLPSASAAIAQLIAILKTGYAPARFAGLAIMRSLKTGLVEGFGTPDDVGSIAHYLNKVIPQRIAELKGPVAYDATILVPAGQAIMSGLDTGLRAGFGTVESFLRDVGPSMEEFVPDSLFADRTKKFMVDVAMGNTPDPYDFYGDLIPEGALPWNGILDPTLGFLHPTMSLADTEDMVRQIAALYNLDVSSIYRTPAENAAAGGSPTSQHVLGQAGDLAGSPSAMAQAARELFERARDAFRQIIFNNRDYIGGFGVPDHMDHVHLGFRPDDEFDIFSGKKGFSRISIPGVSSVVLDAIGYASQQTGLQQQLIAAVMAQESGFRQNVVSFDGGYGLMQLTSSGLVAQADALGGRLNPRANALVGARYLHDLIAQLGSVRLGLSAYNSGPGGGESSGHVDVPAYVESVMNFLRQFGGFREHGGPVTAGKSYIVGEKRPELFVPGTSGRILPTVPEGDRAVHYHDNREISVTTAATDAEAVAKLVEAHTKTDLTGANLR